MRNRFFFIILATLILAAISINLVHVYFFKSQRLKLIDRQIAESSTALLKSKEFNISVKKAALLEETISRVLKGARIGKAFVLRDSSGKIVYQSFNVGLLNTELPIQPEWVAVETEAEYIRVRNVPLPGKSLILQVGLVLDRNFLDWEILDNRVINYVTGIVISLFLASALITLVLLSPLRLLIGHLKEATSNLVNLKDVRPLPTRLLRYTHGFWAKSDEFSGLLGTVQKLIDRINMNYKITKSWTLQMAHELKTPLAIMRAETEAKKKENLLPEKYAQNVIDEIHQMSEIISQFLDWAELESSQLQKDLHALRMKAVMKSVAARLEKISPGRVQLQLNSDFSVFANPIHLDQLITNLVTNALKFSPSTEKVELILSNHALTVKDYGPGIPHEVRERIGEPFNVGSHEVKGLSGNGLGLAWISTVAKLYQWQLEIRGDPPGTKAIVQFPKEDA
ncbi:MAG: HAMP domain-containing histidine kinase [Bdellovibrionales bacterium]|nr:HAMP domain-containing histidine kinase [Bdellovibrionales bacterium]